MSGASNERKESRTTPRHSRMKQSEVLSRTEVNESKEEAAADNMDLSQSLQSFISEVQAKEMVTEQVVRDVQELNEICDRQQQNLCELRCNFEELNRQYTEELKNKEALNAKHRKISQMFNTMGVDCNALTNTLRHVVAEEESFQQHSNEMNRRSQQMQSYVEELSSASLPSIIEALQKELFEEEENIRLYNIESRQKDENLVEQYEAEKSKEQEELTALMTLSNDLNQQIIAENMKSEELSKCLESLSKEKQEEKDLLLNRVENLAQKYASLEADKQIAEKENAVLTGKVQSQQNEILEKKERERILQTELHQLKTNRDNLSETQLKKEAQNKNLELQLDGEAKKNKIFCDELKDIRHQLLEVENETQSRVKVLSEEMSRILSNAAQMETSLQQSLDKAKAEEAALLIEEDNLTQELHRMEEALHDASNLTSQLTQSNSALDEQLASANKEIQCLNGQKKSVDEVLRAEQCTTQRMEQSLVQTKATDDGLIRELHHQLECLKHERLAVDKQLESMKLMEQDLSCKIEEVQINSANTSAQNNENKEKISIELQKQSSNLDKEIVQLKKDFESVTQKLQQDDDAVNEAIEKSSTELNNFNAAIEKFQSEFDYYKNSLNALKEDKENQTEFIHGLTSKIAECSNKLDLKYQEEQIISLKLEAEILEIQEFDVKIAALKLQLDNQQVDLEKSSADNESEKQVFLRDLVKFQQITECRSNEIKGLEKQKNAWKDKIEDLQTKKKETSISLSEQKLNDIEKNKKEIAQKLQEWKGKQLSLEAESKQAGREASQAKKKVDHLNSKIAAHRAAKKKQAESKNETFKVPTQDAVPSSNTTPQFSARAEDEKENTPRSILKRSMKPATPQERPKVTFADDYDDGASSSSSIMLGPELIDQIAQNPAMVNIIAAQHRERHLVAKRMKMTQNHHEEQASTSSKEASACTATPAPANNIFLNEISSSTPENQLSDPYNFDGLL